jgi:peptidoglycan DL-endopeptidase CwlO
MVTFNKKTNLNAIRKPRNTALILIAVVMAVAGSSVPYIRAQSNYQQQIDALNAANEARQKDKDNLGNEAVSIADEITRLQAEINAAQAKINDNEAQMASLKQQIVQAEAELARQRGLLGDVIRNMYIDGDISTIEMLATSKDLSDFFDKQQYQESVRSQIKTTLDKINKLKAELSSQKEIVQKLLDEQKVLRAQLASQKAEKDNKLALNQSQQSAINDEMKANSSKIAELRKKQIEENARLFARAGGGGIRAVPDSSGYPWQNYRSGNWTHAGSCYYGDDIDPWGLCYRQCVSYAAWKTYKIKGYMPYGFGNANNWDDAARARGIPVDTNPQPGDIAVSNSGYWGHVMYVESVNSNGTINISQYNVRLTGEYSEATISKNGLYFIHF